MVLNVITKKHVYKRSFSKIGSSYFNTFCTFCMYRKEWKGRDYGGDVIKLFFSLIVISDKFTWSDSPVRELSSIFKSFEFNTRPSAGSKSPYLTCKMKKFKTFYRTDSTINSQKVALILTQLVSDSKLLLTNKTSPTTISPTWTWLVELFLITEKVCSPSIRLCNKQKCH